MKFVSLVPMLLIFIFSSAVSASAGTISVTDLKVNSANPKLTFIGKGISELIAFELGKSNGAEPIEREKRAALSAVENPARVRPKRGIRSDRHNQERHVSEQVTMTAHRLIRLEASRRMAGAPQGSLYGIYN